jgi:fimbrial chaperone protein
MEIMSQALIFRTAAMVFILMLMVSAVAQAGALRVSPSSLEFGVNAKSGVLSLLNEGSTRLLLQVTASEWSQNSEGKDMFSETSDIVFYPKTIILEADGQQVIRVGTKGSPSSREKSYRLMIEEVSRSNDGALTEDKKKGRALGTRSTILLFVKPLAEQYSGEIKSIDLSGGAATITVMNTGNAHVTVTSVSMSGTASDGKELFTREFAGWHLLSGASSSYRADIPSDICRGLERLDIEVTSNKYSLKEGMKVRKDMCAL